MMFLAHFSNTPYDQVLTWSCGKIFFRFNEAVKVHNKLKPKSEDE